MAKQVKEYLGQFYRTNEFINAKEQQIYQLRELSMKTTSTFNEVGVRSKSNENKREIIICKIVDLENELLSDIDKVVDLSREINQVIRNIDNPDYRLLLEYRYLNGLTWEAIAEEMGFTTQWVNVLHRRALSNIESTIKF